MSRVFVSYRRDMERSSDCEQRRLMYRLGDRGVWMYRPREILGARPHFDRQRELSCNLRDVRSREVGTDDRVAQPIHNETRKAVLVAEDRSPTRRTQRKHRDSDVHADAARFLFRHSDTRDLRI